MFERYTEKARRVIFFARYEASQFGSLYIETEHMLLGLLRAGKAWAKGVRCKSASKRVGTGDRAVGRVSLRSMTLYRIALYCVACVDETAIAGDGHPTSTQKVLLFRSVANDLRL
jgi:hypothetical protein